MMSDTLIRQWQMLRLIPRHPSKVSTTDLIQLLADEGFEITQRSLQRDLLKLSDIYPLQRDERSKPYGWSWVSDASVMDIPGMDSHTALAFWLADQHLKPLLPKTTLRKLQSHFKAATDKLNHIQTDQGMPGWRNKIRVLHRGPNLQSPVIDEDIQNQVYDALLKNRKLSICYQPRESGQKEYDINPLGLVLKDGVSYLVCSIGHYTDIRLLTLHRIIKADILDVPVLVPTGFNLDDYIASGELDFVIKGEVLFKAIFSKSAAFHLAERPLSNDQTIVDQNNGKMLISATILDTSELRWWLLSFGEYVEVLEPQSIRDDMIATIQSAAKVYAC